VTAATTARSTPTRTASSRSPSSTATCVRASSGPPTTTSR
jgi:hypothetical protein